MQFHVLSFEGPDGYARAGGLASRVEGLAGALAGLGFETHLWYLGDPDLPAHEVHGLLHQHRWAQWISRHHPGGVYDGEEGKRSDLVRTLPPHLAELLVPFVRRGGRAVVLAEEWHTAHAVLHLDWLLRGVGVRQRVELLWNANNTFGFERVPFERLREASRITTVSRYMKQRMWAVDVDPLVIPNGLPGDAFDEPDPELVRDLRARLPERTLLAKMARWDPAKRWSACVDIVAALKAQGWRPLLVARGGCEPYGAEVRTRAEGLGLRWVERGCQGADPALLVRALGDLGDADVVSLQTSVAPRARRLLLRGADAVLANSAHEPFGLVALEAMAVRGLACTGCSGEDYVLPGQNALVLESDDPREFLQLFGRLRGDPAEALALRRAARWTARRFAWKGVLARVLLPRLDVALARPLRARARPAWAGGSAAGATATAPTGT